MKYPMLLAEPKPVRACCLLLISVSICGCTGLPEGVQPVDHFDLQRYLGVWYEIARLDHSFERGLSDISAEYSLRDDGCVRVINRGFSDSDNAWREAEGRACFVGPGDQGYLKVSFFGPFYGSYVIFELDRDEYRYAFVSGPDKSYLWLLSRTPTVDKTLTDRFIRKAGALGFDTDQLIFVRHESRG